MNSRFIITLIFTLFLNTAHADCLKIQANGFVKTIQVSGYLISEQEWELPDMKTQFTAWLLKLDEPISICNPTFANQPHSIDCLQIVPSSNQSLAKYKGLHIIVSGNLNDLSTNSNVVTPVAIKGKIIKVNSKAEFSSKNLSNIKNYHCQSTDWSD